MAQLQFDTGALISKSNIMECCISSFSQSPGEIYTAVLAKDGAVHFIDPITMSEIAILELKISNITFSHCHEYLAVGLTTDNSVALHAIPSFERISSGVGHEDVIVAMSFSPNSKYLVTASIGDANITVWHIPTLEKLKIYNNGFGTLSSVLFVSESTFLTGFSTSFTKSCLYAWNTLTDESTQVTGPDNSPVTALILSPNKLKFMCIIGNTTIAVYDSASLLMVHSRSCLGPVQSISFIDNNNICFNDADSIVIASLQSSGAVIKYPSKGMELIGPVQINGCLGNNDVMQLNSTNSDDRNEH